MKEINKLGEELTFKEHLEQEQENVKKFKVEMDKALDTGIDIGFAQGLKRGLERGTNQGIIKTAINLKRLGASIDMIVKSTDLSIEQIDML